jgi:hypothetical protein
MNYYAIGIGGTGAKCIEALTHLCAAGMMPDDAGELYTLFVDADTANGNLERTRVTLNQYITCQTTFHLGEIDLFKTPIIHANPDIWSPVTIDGGSRRSLEDIFGYSVLDGQQKELADLFDVLYSPEEKKTTLEKGFRGHPSIGAAVMANAMDLGEGEPWKTFRNRVKIDLGKGQKIKIFVFGSIFGGTGAAGFPTIARLIRDELVKISPAESGLVKIGGTLVLPYFSFVPSKDDHELKANSEDFILNTQAALKYYYHQQEEDKVYHAIYLIGDENMNPTKNFSIGANTQQNDPHFIEIYAAMAAVDFFKNEIEDYRMLARHMVESVIWEDLPDGNKGNIIRQKIRQLTRFAVAYIAVYHSMIKSIYEERGTIRAPWYVNLFERNQLINKDEIQEHLNRIEEYCQCYLAWITKVHTFSSNNNPTIKLINWLNIENIQTKQEKKLFFNIMADESDNPRDLDKVWEKMCKMKINDATASGIGKFIYALYNACE